MPIIKSAKKRVRTAQKAAVRNSKTKRSLRTAVKAFSKAVSGKKSNVSKEHSAAQSALDKAAKKGLVHKNKVARQKRQLAARARAAGSTTAGAKKTAKPAAAKKTTAKAAPKKTVAKKPAAKKTTTNKKK